MTVFSKLSWRKKGFTVASLFAILVAFGIGMIFISVPDLSAKKYLMPAVHEVRLKADKYSVWYFPMLPEAKDEDYFEFAKGTPPKRIEKNFPIIELTDSLGQFVPMNSVEHSPLYPMTIGISSELALPVCRFDITTPGVYRLTSSLQSQRWYVIAIVPKNAERPSPDFYFSGYWDQRVNVAGNKNGEQFSNLVGRD